MYYCHTIQVIKFLLIKVLILIDLIYSYLRRGDRFWYELPNQPSSFTPEQLQEIRKIKLSRVMCDNTDLIDSIQIYPMVLPDHEL